jgi:hypothetical protein
MSGLIKLPLGSEGILTTMGAECVNSAGHRGGTLTITIAGNAEGISDLIDLSILVCTTNTRYKTFGVAIQDQLWAQYDSLTLDYRNRIEILILNDNKKMMLGRKRNALVDLAQGRYVQFIDDDDRIEPDMFRCVLDATAHRNPEPDVITFLAAVSINGESPKLCRYSKDFGKDRNTEDGYERIPNHICAVKRELAQQVSFPHTVYGEDSGYSKLLLPLLKIEHHIPKVLYHYEYNQGTSETQQPIVHSNPTLRHQGPPVVDLVILSNATTPMLRRSTQRTIDTALSGAAPITLNVIVMEQQHGVTYLGADTVHSPQKFNYNKFANAGAARGIAPWIMVANNDLFFHDGWLHHLLAADYPLVSPKCPRTYKQSDITDNTIGIKTGKHFSGWCFMISRELWGKIEGFDDCVSFWCADDVVIRQAEIQGIEPMIVPDSLVTHEVSQTLKGNPHPDELTWKQLHIYIQKYGHHELESHPKYLEWRAR